MVCHLLVKNGCYVGSYRLLVLVVLRDVLRRESHETWGKVVLVEQTGELRVEFLSEASKWSIHRRIWCACHFRRNEVGLWLNGGEVLRVAESNGKGIARLRISFGVYKFARILLRLYVRWWNILGLGLKLNGSLGLGWLSISCSWYNIAGRKDLCWLFVKHASWLHCLCWSSLRQASSPFDISISADSSDEMLSLRASLRIDLSIFAILVDITVEYFPIRSIPDIPR